MTGRKLHTGQGRPGDRAIGEARRQHRQRPARTTVGYSLFLTDDPSVGHLTDLDWERRKLCFFDDGDEIVDGAGLIRADVPTRAEHSVTAVRRARRGQGIARALEQQTIAWAAANGLCELYTWTQDGNEAMRGLNARLGYVTRSVCTRLRAELPLR